MRRLLLLLGITCLFTVAAEAQTINAASCSSGDVQTALNSITLDGTTVNIPSGTCTWAAAVIYTQTKSFALQGAGAVYGTGLQTSIGGLGSDSTILYDNLGTNTAMLQITTLAGKTFRMTAIAFSHTPANAVTKDSIGTVYIAGASTSVRIDHNHFNQLKNVGLYLAGSINGVIDHNQWDASYASDNNIRFTDPGWNGDVEGYGNNSWADDSHFGTSQFMYAENNNFRWVGGGTTTCSGGNHGFAFDVGLNGGRAAFRYNAVGFHTALQTHGTSGGTGTHRGLRATEVYNNTFIYTQVAGDCFAFVVQFEGGTGLWWGNTVTGFLEYIGNDVVRVHNTTYNETATPNGWGYCGTTQSGTGSNWDQSATGSGYACLDSTGRGKGDLLSGDFPIKVNSTTGTIAWPHQVLEPLYVWNNTINQVPNNPRTYFGQGAAVAAVSTENVDFYLELPNPNNAATFNGTAGIGQGLLSARPATCTAGPGGNTPGVGYWATDVGSGTLYVCNPTNTWTSYYTPYTYPHPLVTGGGGTVSTPNFTPVAGNYFGTQNVTIATSTGGATLCYTIDGTTPTADGAGTCTHGTTYSTPLVVASATTVKAIGSLSGQTDSAVASAAYTIGGIPTGRSAVLFAKKGH